MEIRELETKEKPVRSNKGASEVRDEDRNTERV